MDLELDPFGSFYLDSVTDGKKGLVLTFKDNRLALELVLNFGVVYCYRVANECFRLKLQESISGGVPGIVNIVENSFF